MQACSSCGACCATYRVCFYWAEVDANNIPAEHVVPADRLRVAMRQVESSARCVALDGEVGIDVACTIYERRPQICRDVQPGDPSCVRARGRWGLPAQVTSSNAARASDDGSSGRLASAEITASRVAPRAASEVGAPARPSASRR